VVELQVLIVDDEPAICQVLEARLAKEGYSVKSVGDAESAAKLLSRGDIDICLCDIRLPGMDGIELLRGMKAAGIETYFVMMTAYASVETALEAMKKGAFDYLTKPLRQVDVVHRLAQIAQVAGLQEENRRLRKQVQRTDGDYFISTADSMAMVERVVTKVAPTSGTVLITGESGTGKSFIARHLHDQSERADQSYVSVNCGAIPENLLESELFGHAKGAFTGADRAKRGLFREADGGTILLDEICELPVAMQVKLLHVLEAKEVRPVGSEQARHVDVRIVAASNRDIPRMVRDGGFREDLYYRLNVVQITMPSLRNRHSDLPALIRFFLRKESERLALRQPLGIDPVAEEVLLQYHWPGNIRELQNVIARALVMADGDKVTVADLPRLLGPNEHGGEGQPAYATRSGSLRERVRLFEIEQIQLALSDASGDRREASMQLGIGLSTLYRKLEEYEME